MANNSNLKPIKSTEEARERGRKGGQAAAKTYKRRKLYKELIAEYGATGIANPTLLGELEKIGVDVNGVTNDMALVIGQFVAGIKGNTNAATWLRDTSGQKPVDKVENTVVAPKPLIDLTKRKKNGEKK